MTNLKHKPLVKLKDLSPEKLFDLQIIPIVYLLNKMSSYLGFE